MGCFHAAVGHMQDYFESSSHLSHTPNHLIDRSETAQAWFIVVVKRRLVICWFKTSFKRYEFIGAYQNTRSLRGILCLVRALLHKRRKCPDFDLLSLAFQQSPKIFCFGPRVDRPTFFRNHLAQCA